MSGAEWEAATSCSFYVRVQVTDVPTYRYDPVWVNGGQYGQGPQLDMPHPPAIGDLIYLVDGHNQHTGVHRVVERSWGYASYGSRAWWHGRPRPDSAPSLDIIVVPDEGPFRDDDPGEEDDDSTILARDA